MQDIEKTLAEYEISHALIKGRIHELNAQISGRVAVKDEASTRSLNERRSVLYTQLWDIEYAMREIREYLDSIRGWKAGEKVG